MTFEDWLEMVEDGAITGRGLMDAALNHRASLRKAFEAGRESGLQEREDEDWADDIV